MDRLQSILEVSGANGSNGSNRSNEANDARKRELDLDWVWSLLENDHPLLVHKALEGLKSLGDLGQLDRLRPYLLGKEKKEEVRLHALGLLMAWLKAAGDAAAGGALPVQLEPAYACLRALLEDPNPYFAKGVVKGLGYLASRPAMVLLLDYVLSPQGRLVRPQLVEEALSFAKRSWADLPAWLEEEKKARPSLSIYLKGFDFPPLALYRYAPYPANDYMAQKIRAQGLSYTAYKAYVEAG